MGDVQNALVALIVAAVPGVLIALLAHQLDLRRDRQTEQHLSQQARILLGLELDANHTALDEFWRTINALDKPDARQNANDHLAALAENGLLSYSLPEWSFARWEHLAPQALIAFSQAELRASDAVYRGLRAITHLYARLIVLTPEETEQLNRDRFWVNRFAGWRGDLFARLTAEVERVLKAGNPLT